MSIYLGEFSTWATQTVQNTSADGGPADDLHAFWATITTQSVNTENILKQSTSEEWKSICLVLHHWKMQNDLWKLKQQAECVRILKNM